jgi:hypothetical protein
VLTTLIATPEGQAALFSGAATILAVIFAQWLRGKAKLIAYSPNNTFFQLKSPEADAPTITIQSGQVMVQNIGRQSARHVQITTVPGGPPAGYSIIPSLVHSTTVGANGEWIVEIPFIAGGELITLQVLNGNRIDSVRSEDGVARFVPVVHQRLFPLWVRAVVAILLLLGLVSFFYVLARWVLF